MSDNELDETPQAVPRRRAWLPNLVLGLVILLCGVAMGSIVTAVVLRRPPMHGMRRPEQLPDKIASEMRVKYGLNDEQEQRLRVVFTEHGEKLSDIRAEVQPRVEAEHEALRRAIEGVLTPEQASRWREEFEKMRAPWRFGNSGGPKPADHHGPPPDK